MISLSPNAFVDMSSSSKQEKIQKVLAAAGICSRRAAEDLIRAGRVRVNGEVAVNPALRVDPAADVVEFDGRRIQPAAPRPEGLLLYKKAGYLTSAADPHHRNTVYELLPARERKRRWLYAGRLDKDTEGLLLFVNSGELVHRLTHPSFRIEKIYLVKIGGRISARQLGSLTRGLEIDGRRLKIDRLRLVKAGPEGATLEVVLHQGEKRQIRRMFEHLGCAVTYLRRTAFGPLILGGLAPGESRKLSELEMKELLKAVAGES